MSTGQRRRYESKVRAQAAEATRHRILRAARSLFTRRGIDGVTVADVARRAEVSVATVYAAYGSKEGILRAMMTAALFGERFQKATAGLKGISDPVRQLALTAQVARAVYDGEAEELGLLRGATAFSPALKRMEREFEALRFEMQRDRVAALFREGRQRMGLGLDEARRILWMYTSRDVYRMLVQESGWTPARYEEWLSEAILGALVAESHRA